MGSSWVIGDQIAGRYAVYGALEGGMGSVYIVFDHMDQCPYAIKTIRRELLEANPRAAARFKTEALAWVRLDRHPNIVEAASYQEFDKTPCLILEYVDGGDLSQLVDSGALLDDPERIIRLGIQFCDGMVHAKACGISVHRDIKPANCMLSKLGRLKVSDFGLAKILDAVDESDAGTAMAATKVAVRASETKTGRGMGTEPFMPPEQFIDAKSVDARADVYSFGVMLFQMASGTLPIRPQRGESYLEAHLHQAPPHLRASDGDLDEIVQACLKKHPAERPDDFAVVRGLLNEVLRTRTGETMIAPPERTNMHFSEWIAKARSLAALGLHEPSAAAFKSALLIEPVSFSAIDGLVSQLTILGRLEEALEAAHKGALAAPNDPDVLNLYGRSLKSMGHIEAADRVLARADAARRTIEHKE